MRHVTPIIRMSLVLGFVLMAAFASSCDESETDPASPDREPQGGVDVGPFIEMARAADCAGTRNRLYLIDDSIVFWDRAGGCADNSYGRTLYAGRPESVLCRFNDSFAGPQRGCSDGRFTAVFDTIVVHLDAPDLGLGPTHSVERIAF